MESNKPQPFFELDVLPDDETGTEFMALTINPANDTLWIWKNKQTTNNTISIKKEIDFKVNLSTPDKQVITGIVSRPGQKIYRNDEHGEYFITETVDGIYKDMMKFSKRNAFKNVNLEHEKEINDVYVFESWIVGKTDKIHSILNDSTIEEGSWAISMKVDNPDVWQMIKEGKLKGFSLEGKFHFKEVKQNKQEDIYKSIQNILENL